MSDDSHHEGFKAFQAEYGAESAIIFYPDDSEPVYAFIRVFKDKGGLVRLGLQIADNDRQPGRPAKHLQIAVGRAHLMRLLEDPQDIEQTYPDV